MKDIKKISQRLVSQGLAYQTFVVLQVDYYKTVKNFESILREELEATESKYVLAINATLDEMVGIGGIPTPQEWYDEFTFRLAKYVDLSNEKHHPKHYKKYTEL